MMEVENCARILNEQGWIIEQDTHLGETWCLEMGHDDRPLRDVGYLGGKIFCHGGFFPGHANVHVLFDPDRVEYEEADAFLHDWVRAHPEP